MATLFSGFDNPFSTAKIAADLSQSEYERGRQADAYNALREMYGDQVGNLDWRQAQATDAATQKLPGELEQQQLANQGTRQTNAFNELMNPMRVEQARQTLDFDQQANPLRLQGAQQGLKLTQQKIDSGDQEAADATAERNRNFVLGLTAAAKQRLAAGESPASVWAGLAPHLASMEGADPDKVKAIGGHFLANPSHFIESSEAAANAIRPNTAYMRAQADQARAEAARTRAATAGGGGAKAGLQTSPQAQWGALKTSIGALDQGIMNIDAAVADDGIIDRGTAGTQTGRNIAGLFLKAFGGRPTEEGQEAESAIDNIKKAVSVIDLENMKAFGVGGMNSDARFKAASDAIASLRPNDPPEVTKKKLRDVQVWLRDVREFRRLQVQQLEQQHGSAITRERPSDRAPQGGALVGAGAAPARTGDDWLRQYGVR